MKKSKICLVIIFNHKYDKNIEILIKLYSHRFQNIYFLVPFYDGDRKDVIPVYDSSFNFQGYIAQGYKHFKGDYTHYVFLGDDIVLNQNINEDNILEKLSLDEHSGYIKELESLAATTMQWSHLLPSIKSWEKYEVNYAPEIPSFEEAKQLFISKGIDGFKVKLKNLKGYNGKYFYKGLLNNFIYFAKTSFKSFRQRTNYLKFKYPMARGYSDFIVIPSESIDKFVKYCGVFASIDLFVEVAIPTAMLLTLKKLVQEKDIRLKGKEYWDAQQIKDLEEKYALNLKKLLDEEYNDLLYIHPVKLSKWKL